MENLFYYNNLYDLYGSLLTDKQKGYFEDYYFNNLSLSEMAENYEVSRNAISKQLHNIISKLEYYEDNLKLLDKRDKLLNVSQKIENESIRRELEDII